MADIAWIDLALTSARPRAVAALLRYFHDLDTAEEAFQEACLSALKTWPGQGPPRDPTAWLIFVGRNSGIDAVRRRGKQQALPDEELLSDLDDREALLAERLDSEHYRDDILRLLFICCHPDLPKTQQIALALRIVSGYSVKQIARAFLVSEAAMEQRITRAKKSIAAGRIPFATPNDLERAQRLSAVAAMTYLIFNEGYSAAGDTAPARAVLCDEAIRLARIAPGDFPGRSRNHGPDCAASAPKCARGRTVRCIWIDRSFGGSGPQSVGPAGDRGRARAHRPSSASEPPGPLSGTSRCRRAPCEGRPSRGHRLGWIDRLYATLERMQPSPVITLNRAVAVSKLQGAEAALAMIEPLAAELSGYFYFHGLRGAFLKQLGRVEEARSAFTRAIALANTVAEATHIRMHLDRLAANGPAADQRSK